MIDLQTRRGELVKAHEELVAQLQQIGSNLERLRGAIALCDELLAAQNGDGPASPDAPAEDEKADTYA